MTKAINEILIATNNPEHVYSIREAYRSQAKVISLKTVGNLEEARTSLTESTPDLLVADVRLPDGDSIDLLSHAGTDVDFPMMVISEPELESLAIEAIEKGAVDYWSGVNWVDFPHAAERAVRHWRDLVAWRSTEARLRTMVQVSNQYRTAVLLITLDGVIEYVNPRFIQMTGYGANDLLGKSLHEIEIQLTPGEDDSGLWDTIKNGGEWHGEIQGKRRGGQQYWHSTSVMPIDTLEGRITHALIMVEDITERRQLEEARMELEERLYQARKLETVGTLATGIAHDFNNSLAVISLYSEMSIRENGLSQTLRERLQTIFQQTKQAAVLIQQILDFSRQPIGEPHALELTPYLKEWVKLLKRTLPENIRIELTLHPGEHKIRADPTRLQQALLTLALDAQSRMTQGGRLHFRMDTISLPEEDQPIHPKLPAGDWIRIQVSDSGNSIPDNTLVYLNEPLRMLEARGDDIGLRLAHVKAIVRQYDGHMTVQAQQDTGTLFTIYLPLLKARPVQTMAQERGSLPKGVGKTVLVVEDDEVTRQALLDSLKMLNYRILTAPDGQTALQIINANADRISLILSDVVMPKMGGVELFGALKDRGLDIPIILITGHAQEENLQHLIRQGVVGLISKPPELTRLARAVNSMIENG